MSLYGIAHLDESKTMLNVFKNALSCTMHHTE